MPGTADAEAIARGDILDDPKPDPKPEPAAPDPDSKLQDDPDPESAPKGEADPEADPEAEKKARKDSRIPLSRHKELLDKERKAREAAEARVAQYERGSTVARANEDLAKQEDSLLKMEEDYNKLLADGEMAKARELLTKIRHTERGIIEAKNTAQNQLMYVQAVETARYNLTLERIEEAYPQLDPDSDDFDEAKLDEVADFKEVYERRGLPASKALQKAVQRVFPKAETKAQETATTVAPRVTDAEAETARRKAAAVAKAAETAKSQPPSLSKAGQDNSRSLALTPTDVMKMNQNEFAKLDEEQLKKLRGDDL